jgi:hypothetical protein
MRADVFLQYSGRRRSGWVSWGFSSISVLSFTVVRPASNLQGVGEFPRVASLHFTKVQYPIQLCSHIDELLDIIHRIATYERNDFITKTR